MSAPAIAQGPTPSPTTTPPFTTQSSAPATPTGKALAQAKNDNRRVEIESLRSETTTYYANPDGKTLRMELNLEPVRVKNANGDGFIAIDTTLVETGGVIKPKAIKGDLTLSAGGDTAAIKSKDSKNAKAAARVEASGKLPKPALKGNTATYASVYGRGIDLVVTATPTGFRQQIVIRQRPVGPVSFRIPMQPPKGLSLGQSDKGRPALKTEDGKTFLDIRPAPLLDAVAADPSGDLEAAKVGRAAVALDGSDLVYSPDPAFLANPATTYPVTMAAVDDDWYECEIDTPSSTYCPDGVSSPYDGEPMDTFVNNDAYPDSWSNFNLDRILVGKSTNGSVRWRSYIQFPLPAKSDPFWGSTIENADLILWNHYSSGCGPFIESGITARRVISDWDELEMTWSNQPSVTSEGADTEYGGYNSDDCTGSMDKEWDLIHSVNGIVQAWANGKPNYGFQLTAGNESDITNWRRYRTRESTYPYPAHAPRLSVDFEPPAEPEEVAIVRDYPGDQEVPPANFADDKAWATSSMHDGETVPGRAITPEEALDDAIARNSTVELNAMDASYPSSLSDEDLVAGFDPVYEDPGTPPTPNPEPMPPAPDKVLNANPYFESELAPWTVSGGTLERSTDRAHESDGTASVKVVVPAGGQAEARSEAGIAVRANALHATNGWFYPHGGSVALGWGVDWFDTSGTLLKSSTAERTLAADTWTAVDVTVPPPSGAATAQLRLSVKADPAAQTTLYADELKLLGSEGASPGPGQERTIELPLEEDLWIDSEDAFDDSGDTLWTGAYDGLSSSITERTYLRFDSASITGKQVKSAELRLSNVHAYGCGDSGSGILAQQVTGAWNSGTLSWDAQPVATAANQATAHDPQPCQDEEPATGDTWTWPVTGIVQAWGSGQPNHGLLLRGVNESSTAPTYDRGFASSRSGEQAPTLVVTYIDTTGTSPTPTPDPGDDITPPEVVEVEPTDDAENVPYDAQVIVRFSEPVTNARLSLIDLFEEQEVPGQSSMSLDGKTLTFTPNGGLDSYYAAEVSDAKDAAGNVMIGSHAWWFTNYAWAPLRTTAKKATPGTLAADKLRVRGAEERSGQLVVPTTRPSLLVNVPDAAGPHATAEVQVEHASARQGKGLIWSGRAKAGEDGSPAITGIQVPAGKLRDGWQIRWRARVSLAGAMGAWSDWQSFAVAETAGEPERAAAAADAASIKKFLPTDKDIAKKVTFTECQAASTTESWNGYTKNRFAYCNKGPWVSRVTLEYPGGAKQVLTEIKGKRLVRISTKQTGREFEITTRIWVDAGGFGALTTAPHAFWTEVNDPEPGASGCQLVSRTGTKWATPSQWNNATQEWQITERFRTDRADGEHKIGSCTLTPALAHDLKGKRAAPGFRSFTVRCDTSPLISWHNKDSQGNSVGGCVVMDAIPAQSFAKSDKNEKGVAVNQIYDHIKRALTPGAFTNPAPGGVTFPDLRQAKAIPGGSPQSPLSRVKYSPQVDANRGFARKTCELEFGAEELSPKDKECDEFPFASTEQGAAYAKPEHNFSVQVLSKEQNQGYGAVVTAWYSNNRMLRQDKFYMRLK
ncbi:DNRLRE domain-containing protein [Nonomuraea wenchangensis]|uniref:DNRLRE domain-containing protein n=1 Tax=Nonomuraea wenchangensis TaxID=568860 RepID=UPI00384B3062